jgi:hypothetical protein
VSAPRLRLGELQELFMRLLPRLLDHAHALGYQVRGGELERSRAQAAANAKTGQGIANSLHCDRLAIDLHLFRHGQYLTASEDHRPLGEFWESLHPLCRWGGHFNDGNHYSITHEGRR